MVTAGDHEARNADLGALASEHFVTMAREATDRFCHLENQALNEVR